MSRLALLITLQALLVSGVMAQRPLTLLVGAEQLGAFTNLIQDRGLGETVTLEKGWISVAFLDLWWPELAEDLTVGHHRFPAKCVGRRLELTQELAPGPRGRLRSWTLMGACPVACEVEAHDGEKISLRSLTLRVQGVGAAL